MRLINWIKRKLLLHVPLWIFMLLAGAAMFLLPESSSINQWENVVTPIMVFNKVSNGWRLIQFTDVTGSTETWKRTKK